MQLIAWFTNGLFRSDIDSLSGIPPGEFQTCPAVQNRYTINRTKQGCEQMLQRTRAGSSHEQGPEDYHAIWVPWGRPKAVGSRKYITLCRIHVTQHRNTFQHKPLRFYLILGRSAYTIKPHSRLGGRFVTDRAQC